MVNEHLGFASPWTAQHRVNWAMPMILNNVELFAEWFKPVAIRHDSMLGSLTRPARKPAKSREATIYASIGRNPT
jgi:hypothetical protein